MEKTTLLYVVQMKNTFLNDHFKISNIVQNVFDCGDFLLGYSMALLEDGMEQMITKHTVLMLKISPLLEALYVDQVILCARRSFSTR